jgi:hypothetical protein
MLHQPIPGGAVENRTFPDAAYSDTRDRRLSRAAQNQPEVALPLARVMVIQTVRRHPDMVALRDCSPTIDRAGISHGLPTGRHPFTMR